METTLLFSKEKKCSLVIQNKILTSSKLLLEDKTYVVIFDTNVKKNYEKELKKAFSVKKVIFLSIPASEKSKSFYQLNKLLKKLFVTGCDRNSILVAFGGGVVLDLVGFLGSIFLRGIEVQFFPTSLLAMVDATLGGKTGINTSFGKNLVGSFYYPAKIYLDTSFLKTLSKRHIKEGLSEMIKHFIIYDKDLFEIFYKESLKNRDLDLSIIEKYVYPSLEIKKKIVSQDPLDIGKRQILNFGHTMAHGLEKTYGYSLSHGKAVAIGIILESYLSMRKGILKRDSFEKIHKIFSLLKLVPKLKKSVLKKDFFHTLTFDKKNQKGAIHMVILQEIGECYQRNDQYSFQIDEKELEEAFLFFQENFVC